MHTRDVECAALGWHPKLLMLASAWSDGAVCLWTEKDKKMHEDTTAHKRCSPSFSTSSTLTKCCPSAISFLAWSPEGTRLITGDHVSEPAMLYFFMLTHWVVISVGCFGCVECGSSWPSQSWFANFSCCSLTISLCCEVCTYKKEGVITHCVFRSSTVIRNPL